MADNDNDQFHNHQERFPGREDTGQGLNTLQAGSSADARRSNTGDWKVGRPVEGDVEQIEDTEFAKETLWGEDNAGENDESWMRQWNGREETHAMFRQSYE
ncbi:MULTISPECIES: hypothetical protein [unclassified Paenibacillus]|uniref:hypothetical protein n=1 Tax=unclassified Paenibacillus TaxID=185978 RepID=UPI000BA6F04B|nr:hypothetical protein [Paenibacillus sp. 7541]PAK51212.1 hypothetical protein CHH75_15955 [Paenibacillus sp. 7541]